MTTFKEFNTHLQAHFSRMCSTQTLFVVDVDTEALWNLYLSSFPEGSNPIERVRTYHDCTVDRHFIRKLGAVVTIVDNEIISLWDFETGYPYNEVIKQLSEAVKGCKIIAPYFDNVNSVGIPNSKYLREDSTVGVYDHFNVNLPNFCIKTDKSTVVGKAVTGKGVFEAGLNQIDFNALCIVEELIDQNLLYRGSEKIKNVKEFKKLLHGYLSTPEDKKELYIWSAFLKSSIGACLIKNDVIGTLLLDLSHDQDLETAVKKYEDKVSGINYQRPKALITPKMREDAKTKIIELGLMSALERRYATVDDLHIDNLIFANRALQKSISGDIFDEVPVKTKPKEFGQLQTVNIDEFIQNIVPHSDSIEILFENKLENSLVSLVGPSDATAQNLFKWNNLFSWSYINNFADSVRDRVKAEGGRVQADVCCRLGWSNTSDLDLSVITPSNKLIYYGSRECLYSNGKLDVDMQVRPPFHEYPVENIFFNGAIPDGDYRLFVNCYTDRHKRQNPFTLEIEIFGDIQTFSGVSVNKLEVGVITVNNRTITFTPTQNIQKGDVSKTVWNLDTNNFHEVSALCFSPNYWDGAEIGNKHYLFFVKDCINAEGARGFYNEFLTSDLSEHKKAMELVGSVVQTNPNDNQLSGFGFTRGSGKEAVIRVTGRVTRTVKVIF